MQLSDMHIAGADCISDIKSDTVRNQTYNLFRSKCAPIPLDHNDGRVRVVCGVVPCSAVVD